MVGFPRSCLDRPQVARSRTRRARSGGAASEPTSSRFEDACEAISWRATSDAVTHHLVRVELGDHLIPRESWRIRPKPGTRVTILVVPSGGGGGKNVFRIVAMIALAVASAWLGAQAAFALQLETFAGSGVLTTTGTMVAPASRQPRR